MGEHQKDKGIYTAQNSRASQLLEVEQTNQKEQAVRQEDIQTHVMEAKRENISKRVELSTPYTDYEKL